MPRNIFAWNDLVIHPLLVEDVELLPGDFSHDPDLNDYFKSDCMVYERGLWVKNYKILERDQDETILGLVSLLNDALRFQTKAQKRKYTPYLKNYMEAHPAMKIGRLAIRRELSGMGVGSNVLNLLKAFFLNENRTGCRFITVDAYNKPDVVAFYEKNRFQRIRSETVSELGESRTVSMFFPLVELLEKENQAAKS
jgi:ribosomal protein S18 acetylase RimI-like enzyme